MATLEGYGDTVYSAKQDLLRVIEEKEAETEAGFRFEQTGMHEYRAYVEEKKKDSDDK